MKKQKDLILQQAIAAHNNGKYKDAESLYRKILRSDPFHPDANHNLGILALSTNNTKAALALFKTALKAKPQIEQFWISYLNLLIQEDDFALAKKIIDQAKKFNLNPKLIYSFQAKLLNPKKKKSPTVDELKELLQCYQTSNFIEAKKLSIKIINEFPDHPFSWKILGAVNTQFGKTADALKNNQMVVSLSPNDAEAHNNLGISFYEMGQFDAAEDSYNNAITLKPNFYIAYNNLGNALKKQNCFGKAIKKYTQAIKIYPKYAEAHNNLGVMLEITENLKKAEKYYKNAIDFNPKFAEAYNNLGNIFKKQKKYNDSKQSYLTALNLKPNFAEAYNNLGNVLKQLGQKEDAKSNYKLALIHNPKLQTAKHQLDALNGDNPKIAPREYVEQLFDNYAIRFEDSLVKNLEYKIPKIITQMILNNKQNKSLGSVLDLGCGTGLVGKEIKIKCQYLEGIDLSNAMLNQAREKGVYDRLVQKDIIDYLTTKDLNFDYFISTDVFIYVGDLSKIFHLIKSRNKKNGKLAFSIENNGINDFMLEKTGRYSHSTKYIEYLCNKFDYKIIKYEDQIIRKEKNEKIKGSLFLLEF